MPKGTAYLFIALIGIAMLLVGINIGKNIKSTQSTLPADGQTTKNKEQTTNNNKQGITDILLVSPTASQPIIPTRASSSAGSRTSTTATNGTSTFTDGTCGFRFSYKGSYINQQTRNESTVIYTEENNLKSVIIVTCLSSIPRPPVNDKKEITIGGVLGTLYHDKNPDGSPRDEIIVKHPTNGMEIFLAGYGLTFNDILSSFSFLTQ